MLDETNQVFLLRALNSKWPNSSISRRRRVFRHPTACVGRHGSRRPWAASSRPTVKSSRSTTLTFHPRWRRAHWISYVLPGIGSLWGRISRTLLCACGCRKSLGNMVASLSVVRLGYVRTSRWRSRIVGAARRPATCSIAARPRRPTNGSTRP
jgi:hypothetical protein